MACADTVARHVPLTPLPMAQLRPQMALRPDHYTAIALESQSVAQVL
jgi:hypothetical protein